MSEALTLNKYNRIFWSFWAKLLVSKICALGTRLFWGRSRPTDPYSYAHSFNHYDIWFMHNLIINKHCSFHQQSIHNTAISCVKIQKHRFYLQISHSVLQHSEGFIWTDNYRSHFICRRRLCQESLTLLTPRDNGLDLFDFILCIV